MTVDVVLSLKGQQTYVGQEPDVIELLTDGKLEKLDGGRWGLNHCPDHADVSEAALDAYISDRPAEIDMDRAVGFAKEMVDVIIRQDQKAV